METPIPDRHAADSPGTNIMPKRLPADAPSAAVAATMLGVAAIARLAFGATSPGFTYLAVVLTLGAIGAVLAAGLRA